MAQIIQRIRESLKENIDDKTQKSFQRFFKQKVKCYGWLLKVTSHLHQKEVFDYVMKNKENMPRTSLRYAIEKMPQFLRQEAMKR